MEPSSAIYDSLSAKYWVLLQGKVRKVARGWGRDIRDNGEGYMQKKTQSRTSDTMWSPYEGSLSPWSSEGQHSKNLEGVSLLKPHVDTSSPALPCPCPGISSLSPDSSSYSDGCSLAAQGLGVAWASNSRQPLDLPVTPHLSNYLFFISCHLQPQSPLQKMRKWSC